MSNVIEIKNDKLTVGISTFGAELVYVESIKGTSFLWCGDEKIWGFRAPLLFPICGGVKNDKYTYNGKEYTITKHGFARKTEFEGVKLSATEAEFVLKSNEDTLKQYPFEFVLKVNYTLNDNELSVKYTVENKTDGPMYYSIGSHEAYSCPEGIEEYSVIFEKPLTVECYALDGNLLSYNTQKIMENQKELKLKNSYFEIDALVFKNVNFDKAQLVHKNSSKKISVDFKGCNYFLIWTKPNENYICLEPWQGISDFVDADGDLTHKKGIIKLEKGSSNASTHSIKFED